MTERSVEPARGGLSRGWTVAWILLLLLGAFNAFASVSDLLATRGSGLPSDHTGSFQRLSGTNWTTLKAGQPGTAHYITVLERGYALHELTFAVLFLAIVAIPFRARRRWAWWACWAVLIAYLGYALTFGAHDPAIAPRAWGASAALVVLLLVHIPEFFSASAPASSARSGTATAAPEPTPESG
jgi:hypothetical protein